MVSDRTGDDMGSSHCSSPTRRAPDGGWGWVVVLSSFLLYAMCDGCAVSFGVIYTELLDVYGESKSKTSWVGSVFFSMSMLCGPLASVFVTMFGCRKMTVAAGIITSTGFVLSSLVNSIDLLYVTLGLVAGLGMSFCYVTPMVSVAFYFEKKRAIATGLSFCGSGIGIFIFAPFTEYLIASYGLKGTMLILGGVLFNITACGLVFRPLESTTSKSSITCSVQFHGISKTNSLHSSQQNNNDIQQDVSDRLLHNSDTKLERKGPSQRHLPVYLKGYQKAAIPRDVSLSSGSSGETTEGEQRHQVFPIQFHRSAFIVQTDNCTEPFRLQQRRSISVSCPELYNTVFRDSCDDIERAVDGTDDHKKTLSYFCPNTKRIKSSVKSYAKILCDVSFLTFAVSNFILYFWYDMPYFFIVDRAKKLGITKEKASFIISVIGILNTIGQVFYGFIGNMNINHTVLYVISCILSGLSILIIPLLTDFWYMCTLGGTFGFFVSSNYVMTPLLLVEFLGLEKLTTAYGLLNMILGLGNLTGPPVAGWMTDVTHSYDPAFYSAGVFIALSGGVHLFMMCSICQQQKEHVRRDTGTSSSIEV